MPTGLTPQGSPKGGASSSAKKHGKARATTPTAKPLSPVREGGVAMRREQLAERARLAREAGKTPLSRPPKAGQGPLAAAHTKSGRLQTL